MLLNNRIIWSNNGTLQDLSVKLNDYHTGSEVIDFVAAQDALYIGSDMPFNHRHFEISVANDQASVMSVALWDGSTWNNVVELIDQSAVSGKSLAQSGIVSWVPDRDEVWQYARSTEDIADLSTLKIYDFYWAKVTFSGDLKATTALSYVGHKFSDDNDLAAYYPDLLLSATLTAFKAGKTSWSEQHLMAAEEIVEDLRRKRIIWSSGQILDWRQFTQASVHKVARIAFTAFGDAYKDNRAFAEADYAKAMNKQVFNVDKNVNARLEPHEKVVKTGLFRR